MDTEPSRAAQAEQALRENEGKRVFFGIPPNYYEMSPEDQDEVCLEIVRGFQRAMGMEPHE